MYRLLMIITVLWVSFDGFAGQLGKPVVEGNEMRIERSSDDAPGLAKTQPQRDQNYPTYIVRSKGNIVGEAVDCEVVHDKIREVFTEQIADPDLFKFTISVGCVFDPETHLATRLSISSYFDPLSNEAIEFLEGYYIPRVNGSLLWGTPLIIEKSKGLVTNLVMVSGLKEGPEDPILVSLAMDSGTHYYPNNYDLLNDFVADSKRRFRSRDPEVVLSFISKWFFYNEPGAADLYRHILHQSNYVVIKVYRQFLMDKEPLVFSPKNSMNYAHQCFNEPGGVCL